MSVLALVEHSDGRLSEASRQALTLAAQFGGPVRTVTVGPLERVDGFAPDAWAAILESAAGAAETDAVFAAGTERGNEVMARLAARMGLPLAANCTAVARGDPARVTRLRWGGSLLEDALLHSPCPLITVAPHTVVAGDVDATEVDVPRLAAGLDARDLAVRVTGHTAAGGGGVSLAEARVIVSGGRGVGSKEGFAIIEELAGLLGAAVGCSRAVTSAGWRPHSDQVGQTGTKVAPEVYIACGISGATQHMAGLKGAKRILAINSDPQAPLMLNADFTVTGDLKEIVPAISAEIRRQS